MTKKFNEYIPNKTFNARQQLNNMANNMCDVATELSDYEGTVAGILAELATVDVDRQTTWRFGTNRTNPDFITRYVTSIKKIYADMELAIEYAVLLSLVEKFGEILYLEGWHFVKNDHKCGWNDSYEDIAAIKEEAVELYESWLYWVDERCGGQFLI